MSYYSQVPSNLINQIKRREELFSSSESSTRNLGTRNDSDLRYLLQKNSWVRLISGANTTYNEKGSFEDGTEFVIERSSPNKAKEFILYGGVSRLTSSGIQKTEGINFSPSDEKKTYNYTSNLGIRPEPGLTSFKIKHIGTWGQARQAEIGFVVWTQEDLELAQMLYLSPGLSVIMEWGNSIYLNNNGEIEEFNSISNLKQFFSKRDIKEVLAILENNRINSNFNYDGFVGLVTNFSFSLREDGGYDCTLTVVSHGTVINSWSIQNPVPSLYTNNESSETSKKNKSFLHNIIYNLDGVFSEEKDPLVINFDSGFLNNDLKNKLINELKKDLDEESSNDKNRIFNAPGFIRQKESGFVYRLASYAGLVNKDIEYTRYITLRTFLGMVNLSISSRGGTPELLGQRFNLSKGNKYQTYPGHFSINPLVCLLPKKPENIDAIVNSDGLHTKISTSLRLFDNDDILEIRINFKYIIGKLEEFFNTYTNPSDANLLNFIKSILNDIEAELGSVNSFDLFFNENINEFEIVDRSLNPKKVITTIPEITLTGLKTQISKLNIQSSITDDLASTIAISAQAANSVNPTNSRAYTSWLKGRVDRFRPNVASYSDSENEIGNLGKYKEKVSKAYVKFSNEIYEQELFDDFRTEALVRIPRELSEHQKGTINTVGGIIPITLELTMDGIGGFKIGQIFRPNSSFSLLPNIYRKFGFIVVGVSHTVENDKWFTTLSAILFPIEAS